MEIFRGESAAFLLKIVKIRLKAEASALLASKGTLETR
jgi:hypothetical protein